MRAVASRRWRRAALALGLATALSACGSTVSLPPGAATAAAGGGNGLSNLGGTSVAGSQPGAGTGVTGGGTGLGTGGSANSGLGGGSGSVGPAGGSTTHGGTGTGTSSGNTSARTGSGKSVTGPIKIGFVVTNVSNAGSLGISSGQSFSDQQLYSALVKAMNASGGLDGRQIQPIYATTDTASSNWSSQFQAACAKFTQDNHVAAVIGYIFVYLDDFENCLARAGVVHMYGGYQPGDEQAQAQDPTLFATTNPTGEGHFETVLDGALQSHVLTSSSKLGIILDSCAHDDRAWPHSGPPILNAHHIHFEAAQIGCSSGSSDNGGIASAIQNAELRFRSHGDNVVFVEGVPALIFMEEASNQDWHPNYIMSVGGAALEGNVPADQLSHIHGFSWMPEADVAPSDQPYKPNPAQQRCLAMLHKEGLQPKAYNDYMEAYTTCDGLFLYAAALQRTKGNSAPAGVVPALHQVASGMLGASTYDGRMAVTSAEHGGPAMWREYSYNSGCGCLRYTGVAHAIPGS